MISWGLFYAKGFTGAEFAKILRKVTKAIWGDLRKSGEPSYSVLQINQCCATRNHDYTSHLCISNIQYRRKINTALKSNNTEDSNILKPHPMS
jgi:hypothetical protein